MKKILSKIIHGLVPYRVLSSLFPSKYVPRIEDDYFRFVKVNDEKAGKPFYVFLRPDAFIEISIRSRGLYGDWEKESLKIWAFLSKRAKVIFDIGANTGMFSLVACNNNPDAKIIAVEPIDINFDILTKNIRKNKFNIIAEKKAVSGEEGTAVMYMLKDRLNYMTSVNDNRYEAEPTVKKDHEIVEIQVPIVTFESIFLKHQLEGLDLIKLDVEGHEISVLNAMQKYIAEYKPTVLIEVIGDDNARQLQVFFSAFDYAFVAIHETKISEVVTALYDNEHHNFLICTQSVLSELRSAGLLK